MFLGGGDGRQSVLWPDPLRGAMMWGKIRSVLTATTNVLTFGRSQGWWERKQIPTFKEKK